MTKSNSQYKEETAYNKSLDGLRGIAILLVILWHYIACLLKPDSGIASFTRSLLASSWSGVDLFFVLSGFLLGRILIVNIDSKNFYSTFYIRRMLRIFPLYYLFLVIFFLIRRMSIFFPLQIEYGIPSWTYFLHIQNFFMGSSFGDPNLGVTWSLAIEEQFYLILPILIRITKHHLKYFIIVAIFIAPIVRYLTGGNTAYVILPARIDSLMFGVGLAYLLLNNKLKWSKNNFNILLAIILLILGLIATLSVFTSWNRTGGVWNHTVYAILYTIILITVLNSPRNLIHKILESPALVNIGKVSYGLYLIHVPVITILFYVLVQQEPKLQNIYDLAIIIFSFLFCLLLLFFSYRFYEAPFRNFGKKFTY